MGNRCDKFACGGSQKAYDQIRKSKVPAINKN